MKNVRPFIFPALSCIFIITFILIKNIYNSSSSLSIDHLPTMNGCTIQNNSCEFVIDQQNFNIKFAQTPIPEEEIRLVIRSNSQFTLTSAWVEGMNMYMGKSPVIAETVTPTEVEGIIFLGSCNLETMEWQITLNFENKTHPVQVRFFTTLE